MNKPPKISSSYVKTTPITSTVWEQLCSEFSTANDDLEHIIIELTDKLAPFAATRLTAEDICSEKGPEQKYNSTAFQRLHEKIISLHSLIARLKYLKDSIEV